jgi:GH15 family glucan-1,4-alpha-glucosidase
MLLYRDDAEGRDRFRLLYTHPPTGLPLASYDLWEERYGVHAFTVVSICAGLEAASRLLAVIASQPWAEECCPPRPPKGRADDAPSHSRCHPEIAKLAVRCEVAASKMKTAFLKHFWSADRRSFGRMLTFQPDGSCQLDPTLDASTLYSLVAFDVFNRDEPQVRATIDTIEQRLWCKTAIGGMARYENDYYHRVSSDIAAVPGNPWFICTLWAALGRTFLAERPEDLARPREILEWACDHARPSGVLAEQVHPYTGEPMSVAPLTWSHATFVETVLAYAEKYTASKSAS